MSRQLAYVSLLCLLSLALTSCGAARERLAEVAATAELADAEATATLPSTAVTDPTAPVVADSPPKELYAVGDRARMKTFRVTVTDIKTSSNVEGASALDGRQFVLIDLTLENTSAERQEVASLVQMVLEDSAGKAYSLDISASASSALNFNGVIEAGEQVSGTIGFQLPLDVSAPRFVFRTLQPGAASEAERVAFAVDL